MTRAKKTPGLLVSVRTACEVPAALAGGATLIDIKEPTEGPLGKAADSTIAEIVRAVGNRVPVSVALGEWADFVGHGASVPFPKGVQYLKWGLARCHRNVDWRDTLVRVRQRAQPTEVVFVAYADAECAQAPSVEEIFALAIQHRPATFLLDTHCKTPLNGQRQKPTLLDWISEETLESLCERSREANVRIALAGSLGPREIERLAGLCPDWFAVRGAVCAEGDREGEIAEEKVRHLKDLIVATSKVSVH